MLVEVDLAVQDQFACEFSKGELNFKIAIGRKPVRARQRPAIHPRGDASMFEIGAQLGVFAAASLKARQWRWSRSRTMPTITDESQLIRADRLLAAQGESCHPFHFRQMSENIAIPCIFRTLDRGTKGKSGIMLFQIRLDTTPVYICRQSSLRFRRRAPIIPLLSTTPTTYALRQRDADAEARSVTGRKN